MRARITLPITIQDYAEIKLFSSTTKMLEKKKKSYIFTDIP